MAPQVASSMTLKRISREMADLSKEDTGSIHLAPSESSMFNWTATLPGPEGSPYEGGEFQLAITLPSDYPFSSPKISFKTRIYHMNVSDPGGSICIDILKSNWSAALSLYKVVLSISSLLTDPNPNDPLVPPIAELYRRNRKQHDENARKWTQQYAKPKAKPKVAMASSSAPNGTTSSVVSLVDAQPTASSRTRTSRSARPRRTANRELIDLSDEPVSPVATQQERVPTTSADNPIEIESSPEPDEGPTSTAAATAGRKRRREDGDADGERRSTRRRGNAGASSRTNGHADAEVIVLD